MQKGGKSRKKNNEFGQPLHLHPYKGRIHDIYNQPFFLKAFSDCRRLLNEKETEVLLAGRNRVGAVCLPHPDGGKIDVVIKEFLPLGVNRLKSLFLQGKAFKSWRGASALVQRGIETPLPVAYLEKRKGLFLELGFFLAERIRGVEEIRFFFLGLPCSELGGLLVSLARHLSRCHREGILHSDLSDGNILIKREGSGEFRFYLLDTNRIQVKKRIGLWRRIKNLIRLGVPPELQPFFIKNYLGAPRLKKSIWLWYRMNKVTYSLYVELKKKLRLRKLSRKLKIQ